MGRKEALRRVYFLKTLSEEVVASVAGAGEERSLRKGELLFAENSPCLGLIVVLTGAIKIYKVDGRGRELTLALERPGASVAELPLFDGGPYPANAEAAADGTAVLVVPPDRFHRLMRAHPQIAEEALRSLAARMRALVEIAEAQSLHSVRERLAAYLLRASAGQTSFPLTETNEAIGGHIGTVRDVVSRTLQGFREAEVIGLDGRTVLIRDVGALRRLAGGVSAASGPPSPATPGE